MFVVTTRIGDGYELEEGEFKIKGYDGPTIPCDKCDGEMQLKTGRFGPYFACTTVTILVKS